MDEPDAAADTSTVLVDVHDGIATVTLNRPERRNAVSWQLLVDLIDALERARSDARVRVVVLTGAGRHFCVGADLARVASNRPGDQETRTLRGRSREDDIARLTYASSAIETLVHFPKPTVAAVNGGCAGAGLSIALAADLQVAAQSAVVNTAFVSAGVSGDLGSAWLLTRAVGAARARSLLLDPVKMTAEQTYRAGIFTEVTADLDSRVDELARKLAGQSALAMAHAKQNILDSPTLPLTAYLTHEVRRMVDSATGNQARGAARDFVSRRTASPGKEGEE